MIIICKILWNNINKIYITYRKPNKISRFSTLLLYLIKEKKINKEPLKNKNKKLYNKI